MMDTNHVNSKQRPQFHKVVVVLFDKRMCHVPANCTIPLYPNDAAAPPTLFLVDKSSSSSTQVVHTQQVLCPSTVNYFLSIFKGNLFN
jgi:hypothetical protein